MMQAASGIRGVFFDLDGTLLDSAPDLYAALEVQCAEEGVAPPAYALVRAVVSRGASAVLRTAFAARGEEAIGALLPHFLAVYQARMTERTCPFPGIDDLLARIEACGWAWGIVSNKAGFLVHDIVRQMGWSHRARAVVAGDTLAVRKPDPAPVRLACAMAGIAAEHAVFVGDDRRDIAAGGAAGLFTVAAAWGYLDGGDPHDWGADVVLDTPAGLTAWLQLAPVTA